MRTYFFDLDGTLADTDRDIREAWKAALVDLGLSCPSFDDQFVAGPPIEDMLRTLLGEDVYSDDLANRFRAAFAEHYDHDGFPNTFEYPGVLDAARRLKAQGHRLMIVTNKRYVGAKALAEKFGWFSVFEALHTGDMDVALGLPNAHKMKKGELLKRIIAAENLEPSLCTMVGDTINDFRAAKEAGIESLAVPWGYGTPAEYEQATRRITSPDALS